MNPKRILTLIAVVAMAMTCAARADDANRHGDTAWQSVVYTQTNAAEGNEILAFRLTAQGDLHPAGAFRTHGSGTGASLGSQGAVALSRGGSHLYAVNAGSDSISVFARTRRGLTLVQRVASGGDQPVSLTLRHDLLYVLNAGAVSNITGFRVGHDGRLRSLRGSTRPLSGDAVMPAQVAFNNTGDFLMVTEKATDRIDLYSVEDDVPRGPFVNDSSGMTPFGFAFDRRDRPIVTEAFADVPGGSAISSHDFDAADAPLQTITASLMAGQTAACWIAITRDGRYGYVTNTGSGTVTAVRIARNGELSLLSSGGVDANTGTGSLPADVALSRRSDFLFVLAPGTGTLHSFKVRSDGRLAPVAMEQGIPASAQGLAAH